jgi:hypothetical protein
MTQIGHDDYDKATKKAPNKRGLSVSALVCLFYNGNF